jgi:hypothetical protein
MELHTVTEDPHVARKAYLDYRRALTSDARRKLGEAEQRYRQVDEATMRGYRALSQGKQLINLTETVRAGGVMRVPVKTSWQSYEAVLPRIAVCRADARRCHTQGVDHDGMVNFYAGVPDRYGYTRSKSKLNRVSLPDGTFGPEDRQERQYNRSTHHIAVVPTIPPPLRPPHNLSGYRLLWEADWSEQVPVDPALLKHVGGDLYAVVAVWDLSELERAVLAGH